MSGPSNRQTVRKFSLRTRPGLLGQWEARIWWWWKFAYFCCHLTVHWANKVAPKRPQANPTKWSWLGRKLGLSKHC